MGEPGPSEYIRIGPEHAGTLKRIRRDLGLRQIDFANFAAIDQGTVSEVEAGKKAVYVRTADLATALGIDADRVRNLFA